MTRNPMLRKLRVVLVVLVLGATGWVVVRLGGKRGTPSVDVVIETSVWALSDGLRVQPGTTPSTGETWDGETIRLQGARNEMVAWQVAVRAASPVIGAEVTCDPFGGADGGLIATNRIEVFRQHLLDVTVPSQFMADDPVPHRMGPGEYPCQLIPMGAADRLEVQAGRTAAVWLDVHIPEDAAPGIYTSSVTLAGGGLDQVLPIQVEVWDFALPRETHFRNFFYYGPEHLTEYYGENSGLLYGIERGFHRLAHDHRVSLGTEPQVTDPNYNWGAWWARFGPYLDGSAFPDGPCHDVGVTLWPLGIPDIDEETYKAVARTMAAFFEQQGCLDRVFLGLYDEPATAEAYELIRRLGRLVDAAVGDQLKTVVTEQVAPEKPEWGSLLGTVDIFCSAKSTDADMATARSRGAEIWVYNGGFGGGPYIDVPALGVVAWGPAAWRFGVTGWYMWDSMYWRQKHYKVETATDLYADPLTFDETRRLNEDGTPYRADWALRLNGDGVFFYPGEPVGVEGPVGCIRLKAFRRGAQDYEYLWLLAEQGKREQADAFARRLSLGRGEWEQNPNAWIAVRREMAALLTGVTE